ncbi:unnamed protein product, partial [Ectocarpus sp. 12 AP-2014]
MLNKIQLAGRVRCAASSASHLIGVGCETVGYSRNATSIAVGEEFGQPMMIIWYKSGTRRSPFKNPKTGFHGGMLKTHLHESASKTAMPTSSALSLCCFTPSPPVP